MRKKIIIAIIILIVVIGVGFLIYHFSQKNQRTATKPEVKIQEETTVPPGTLFTDGSVKLQEGVKGLKKFSEFYPPTGLDLEGVYDIIEISSKDGITTIVFYSHDRQKYILQKPDDLVRSTKSGRVGQMYSVVSRDKGKNHLFFVNYGD